MVDGYQKCLDENARPECDFKYFSKSKARCLSRKAKHAFSSQGAYWAV